MKLLTKSTWYYSIFAVVALFATGISLYFTIRSIVYRQIDESLLTEKSIIQAQLDETDTIPDFTGSLGHQIEVNLEGFGITPSQIIRDTDIYDLKNSTLTAYRYIRYKNNTPHHTGYIITIYRSLEENKKLLDSIGLGMFFLFVALLLVSLIVNYLISKSIWSPFYKAVEEAQKYDVLSDKPLDLPETNINEFRQINEVLSVMTRKMRRDYLNLKEYNENSSHELQTPLAVIRSKLDLLMQNKRLNKDSIELIKSISDATSRIFKLNQGLMMISKIDNRQFPETKEISLKKLIKKFLRNYDEIMELKKIRIMTDLSDRSFCRMNETLADVMISNLLGNAVRYNIDGGFINCVLDQNILTITNSGLPLKVDPETLFDRFGKGSDHPEAVGLGLSIVKKIADHYRMKVTYTNSGTVHEVKLVYRGHGTHHNQSVS